MYNKSIHWMLRTPRGFRVIIDKFKIGDI